jgi:Domain of unknown function (DUF6894)
MPRFYFHLKDATHSVPDEDGSELPHVEAAYLYAFECAQELWGILLGSRNDPTIYTLEVVDACGNLMFLFPLTEVLDTARERPKRLAKARRRTVQLLTRNEKLRESLTHEINAMRQRITETFRLLKELRDRSSQGR